MQDEEIVQVYVETIAEKPDTDDEVFIAAMAARDVKRPEAVAAIHFSQVAFGRFLLEDSGANLSVEYVRMRPEGEIYQRGILETAPMFVEARRLAVTEAGQAAFAAIAQRSPEIHLIRDRVQRGADPAAGNFSPVIIIDAEPTPTGMQIVRNLVHRETSGSDMVN
jgi:hypothetical protein